MCNFVNVYMIRYRVNMGMRASLFVNNGSVQEQNQLWADNG